MKQMLAFSPSRKVPVIVESVEGKATVVEGYGGT